MAIVSQQEFFLGPSVPTITPVSSVAPASDHELDSASYGIDVDPFFTSWNTCVFRAVADERKCLLCLVTLV